MAKMTPPPDDAPHRWAIVRLQQRIESSGMSVSKYAQTQGFPRAPNTVYRWLRGEYPIPAETRRWLLGDLRLMDHPHRRKRRWMTTPNTTMPLPMSWQR